MRPNLSSLLVTAALLALAGCQTPQPSGSPSSGGQQMPSGSAGSSGSSGSSAPQSTPQSTPSSSSGTSTHSGGSATPPSSQSNRTASSESGGSAQPGSAQTSEERRAAIDRRLDTTLGTFDEQIRKEQERVAKEKDARDATGPNEGDAANSDAKKEGDGAAGSAETESPVADSTDKKPGDAKTRPGDLKSDKDRAAGVGNGAASGSGAGAQNIPDGSDDDVVARRLRKAAEQETDPELKEKLWKEYIEYKKNAGK